VKMNDVSSIQNALKNVVKNNPNHIAVKELNTGREITYLSLYEKSEMRSENIDDTPYGIICLPDGIDCAIEFLAHAFIKKPFLARHPSASKYESSLQDKFLKENFHPIPDGCQIKVSSGTTNKAKFFFVKQSHRVFYARQLAERLKIIPNDTVFCPVHTTYGIGDITMMMTLISGATFYCNNDLQRVNKKIEEYILDISQYQPSVVVSSSLTISEIAKVNNIKLSPRVWCTGGGPLNYEDALKIENQISGVVLNRYGISEGFMAHMCSIDDTQDKRFLTIGKIETDKIRLGENGEVLISRDFLYDFMPTKFNGDWYNIGDFGRIDEDGYLVLTGRKKLLISLGGRDINPLEVESLCSGKSCLIGIDRVLYLCVEDDIDPRNYIEETLKIRINHLWQGKIPEMSLGKIDRIKMTEIIKQEMLKGKSE